jgi:ATP-dependent Lhr-like helicase
MDRPAVDVVDRWADEAVDTDVLELLDPAVREWWAGTFGEYVPENGGFFTPPQREGIPLVHEDRNALICAPTGSGKTLASFTAVLDELFRRERADGLADAVYCLYVSPLKALANDVHRNLEGPLDGIRERLAARGESTEVRQAIRHGDTDEATRRRMLAEPPHVLNTTPETLAILLNSPKFREKLRTVEYVIVDEVHALAANKRGTHLSVSLERLEDLTEDSPTRIGCSATVEPVDTMAEFLVGRRRPGGEARDCAVVDARFAREFDLRVDCPVDDLAATPDSAVRAAFYDRLDELVSTHTNTLVFTNTRSGAERVLQALRERPGYDENNAACHHGSLARDRRTAVERALKRGDLDVVTTSTSLELGVDMPHVDLVVQVGSPKSVASLLQRVGRAGHQVGQVVEGRVIALDRDDLIECAVAVREAESGSVDRVFVPENAYDVAAQHVYGMAINGIRPEAEVRATLRRAYPYRDFDDAAFETLVRYLTADYEGLTERNVYPKIWRDRNDPPGGEHHHPEFDVGERLIGKRGRLARMIYLTNVGTIPDSFSCDVIVRGGEWVGELDEDYLDTLDPGDVFVIGGERFAFRYRRGSKVYVDRTTGRPTVPSWYSERLPLSVDLARAIRTFQQAVLDRLSAGGPPALRDWLRGDGLSERAVRALTRLYAQQLSFAGAESVSTLTRIAVEEERDRDASRRRYYVHTVYGRRFNDGLSRLLLARCASETSTSVTAAVADNGFVLSMPLNRRIDVAGLLRRLDPADVRDDLRTALRGTDLRKRYFRIDATRSLMILKRYKGTEKSAARQQVESETLLSLADDLADFAVIEETDRELLEDKLDVDGIERSLERIQSGEIEVVARTVETPTPRAFGLATLAATDTVIAADEDELSRNLHERVMAAIEGNADGDDD